MYASLLYEYDYSVDPAWVEGAIPADLVGTCERDEGGQREGGSGLCV
jgi:hypothetical protein